MLMPSQTKNDDKKPTSTPSGKVVDTITNVGAAALLAKGAKKMYDNSKKKATEVKAPDFAGGPGKGKDPRGTGKIAPAPAPPTTKKESAPATKKAPATAKKEYTPKPSAPTTAPKPSAPAPSAKPSIWTKFRQATKAGAGAASAAGSGSVPKGSFRVSNAVQKGARIASEAVKRNPKMALAAGAAALGYAGYKYLKNKNANKQEQPMNSSMTKTTETQSKQPMNSNMTETTKTQSNAEANKPTETPKPVSRSESKYPTYQKDSAEAKDFRSNFAKARKEQGKDGTFEWQGRKYNTKLKGE